MAEFAPKTRAEIMADMVSSVLAEAPITSAELGEVSTAILQANADQFFELNTNVFAALSLLSTDTKTGAQLDKEIADYPDMPPRFQASHATTVQTVRDPAVTKKGTRVAAGGGVKGKAFLNVETTADLPASGVVLVGVRGQTNFERVPYTAKQPFQLTTAPLKHDHAAQESVVLATVGDRKFDGPFALASEATANSPAKTYKSTSPLVIYDGEQEGVMNLRADEAGKTGNTASNTIRKFLGTPPFPGAQTWNPQAVVNGSPRESDPELLARLKRHKQANGGNIDAIYEAAGNVNIGGQRVVFQELVEPANPRLPSLLYIDDGSAFVPTLADIEEPIILEDSALGGRDYYFIPMNCLPIVTTDEENAAYVFSNIELMLDGKVLQQGPNPGQYELQPNRGVLKLHTPVSPGARLEVTRLRHYTGLIQAVNTAVYGDRANRDVWPGAVAHGAWVQVRNPEVYFVSVEGNVILDGTRAKNEIITEVTQRLLTYVNGLGVGGSVVHSKLIALCHVRGVKSVSISTPTANIEVLDGMLARLEVGNVNIT